MLVSIYHFQNGKVELKKQHHSIDELLPIDAGLVEKAAQRNLCITNNSRPNFVVDCDLTEIQQLFQHLLDNACKHARSEIVLGCAAEGNWLDIYVSNDGDEIVPDDLDTLFDRFHYVSNDGRYAAWTGVGLCLCAEIAKAHQGKISCESSPVHGVRFTVKLPLAREAADTQPLE